MAGGRTVIGISELAALGDRRRWIRINLLAAAATSYVIWMAWLAEEHPQGLGAALLLLFGVAIPVAVWNYRGRRFDVVPDGVPRLAGAPQPIVDALVDLAILRGELERGQDPTEIVVGVRDWLARLSALPPSAREWLARRQVSGTNLHAAQATALGSDAWTARRLLLAAIIEFERNCEREELRFDPYRGTVREPPPARPRRRVRRRDPRTRNVGVSIARLHALLVLLFAVLLGAAAGVTLGFERWCSSGHLGSPDPLLLMIVTLACVPTWFWAYAAVAEHGARIRLTRIIGALSGPHRCSARVLRAAKLERVATASIAALVFVVSLGLPALTLHLWSTLPPELARREFADVILALVFTPSVVVGLGAASVWASDRARRALARRRAQILDGLALRCGHQLPPGLLEAVEARGDLLGASLHEHSGLLRMIADGLAQLDRIPAPLEAELARAGFEPGVLAGLLRCGLTRGVAARVELHALAIELGKFERMLAQALERDVHSR